MSAVFHVNAANVSSVLRSLSPVSANKELYLKFDKEELLLGAASPDGHLFGTVSYEDAPEGITEEFEPRFVTVTFPDFQRVLENCAGGYCTELTGIDFTINDASINVVYILEPRKGQPESYAGRLQATFSIKNTSSSVKSWMKHTEGGEPLFSDIVLMYHNILGSVMTDKGTSANILFTNDFVYVGGNIHYALRNFTDGVLAAREEGKGLRLNKRTMGIIKIAADSAEEVFFQLIGNQLVFTNDAGIEGGVKINITSDLNTKSYNGIKPTVQYVVDRQRLFDVLTFIGGASSVANSRVYLNFVEKDEGSYKIKGLSIHAGNSEEVVEAFDVQGDDGSLKDVSAGINPADVKSALLGSNDNLASDEAADNLMSMSEEDAEAILNGEESGEVDSKTALSLFRQQVIIKVDASANAVNLVFTDAGDSWMSWMSPAKIKTVAK